jgi:transcription antitermination protein NusB
VSGTPSDKPPSSADTTDIDAAPYTGGVGSRREARERALGLLYEAESKELEPFEVIDDLVLEPDAFTAELVIGVGDHLDEIDAVISAFARGWSIARMPALDRALLRLGVFELVHRPEIPTGAVISEAVELAKRFSTEESGKFVNGVLSAVAADTRP